MMLFLSDDKHKTLFHGHSFTANPLACTSALASLDLLLRPETTENIARISQRHTAFLGQLKQYALVRNSRQWGTFLAFDIVYGLTNLLFSYYSGYCLLVSARREY